MNPASANTLILECGTMVGHQQHELEIPQAAVPFFNIPAGSASMYFSMRLSNGLIAMFRGIYRPDNGMWRIEFSTAVPEIVAGIFPPGSRRSNFAAVFTKIPNGMYDVRFIPLASTSYTTEMQSASVNGVQDTTISGASGRAYGWY